MPIYDFKCTSCGFSDELMRKISQPSLENCPKCAKNTFAKLLSAPSFQLNGTGWYASDFKDKKPSNSDKKDAKPDEKTTEKAVEKTTEKAAEKEPKAAACNPGCACH